jgi:transposase
MAACGLHWEIFMQRFIQGHDRTQASLLPACLEDYVEADNLARVIEAFVEALDLGALGFSIVPASTGRPSYHPATLLKLYIYGYLNCIQSSRRLERECGRNVELMWLTGRLAPDFKTIADFRRDNGPAICAACSQFIVVCRQSGLFTRPVAAIDGSKFKGVKARDKNFTRGKVKTRLEKLNETIARYLTALDAADRQESMGVESGSQRLRDKLVKLRAQMQKLKALEAAVESSPDKQVSLTDPDTRLMVIGDRLTGVVGYNVQTAVETEHHLIVAHEVTNQVVDRGQLPKMAAKAKEALDFDEIEAIADAGYYRGPDLLACRDIGVTALMPRTNTSRAKAEGRFSKEAFIYLPEEDAYRCPAGRTLTHRYDTVASGLTMLVYWCSTCSACPIKNQCTPQIERRIQRWEHENVVETMNSRMEAINAMAIRRETAEHPFSTIKAWMGATHFLCKGLQAVRTEMSLNVLAYNIRRIMKSFGAKWLQEALAT